MGVFSLGERFPVLNFQEDRMRRKSIILLVMILLLFPSIASAESSGVLNEEPPNTQVEFILLTRNEPKNISHAVISSSGNRVVYVVEESTGASVFVVNSDGSGESLLFESGKLTDPKNSNIHFRLQSTCTPAISGDGNTVAFSVEELPGEQIGRYLLIYNFSGIDWQGPEIVDFKDLSKKDYDYDVYSIGTSSISYDGSVIVTAISFKYFDIWDSCIAKTDKSGAGPFSILHFDSFKYTLGGDPVVSGNGEKVIFCGREEDDYNSPYVLYFMNSDGSGLKNISPTGTILGKYGGGDYHISTTGKTVGLRCEDINDSDEVQYKIINTLDSSVIATVKNYEGDSVYSRIFGRPQMIEDGNKVVYISSNSYLEINKVYIKDIINDGDLTLLNDKTKNLPWEYTYVNVAGSALSSSIGTTRYMDNKGTKFLIKKGVDRWDSVNLYLIKIKGKKKPPISTGFQLQWTDIDEKYDIDLKDCFIKFDENSISFKITTYREWKNYKTDFYIAIYFNIDKDSGTGALVEGWNGEDMLVTLGNDGGIFSHNIYEWKNQSWQKIGEFEIYEIEDNSKEATITLQRKYFGEDFEYWVGIYDQINEKFDYYPNDDQYYYEYFKFEGKEQLPSYFDWRNYGGVTPIKDQLDSNLCWVFSSIGALESEILINEGVEYDFSEQDVVLNVDPSRESHFDEEDDPYVSPGSITEASEVFIRKGVTLESCNPFNPSKLKCGNSCSLSSCESIFRASGVNIIKDADNIEAVKKAIYNYGPLVTCFYNDDDKYYNDTTYGTIYDYYLCNEDTNHCIIIVGWDDDVPHPDPGHSGKGAWICRNSWGENWGNDGYFYIAYNSGGIGRLYYFNYERCNRNKKLLYWDEAGWVYDRGYPNAESETAWMASVYTAEEESFLEAVSFWSTSDYATYDIYVYDDFFGATLLSRKEFSCSYAGYYTVPLKDPIPLKEGQKFTLVAKVTTPGYYYPIAYEEKDVLDDGTVRANPPIQENATFMKLNEDDKWYDTSKSGFNICFRAVLSPVSPSSQIELLYPNGGESFNSEDTVNIKWTSSNLTKGKIRIYLFDGEEWSLIASNLSINDNSYTWTVPDVSSQECKIRIENYNPKSNSWILRDDSDGYFSILSPLYGNISVKATLDGKEWKGNINYTISGPENLYGDSVPKDFYRVSTGKYTISYISGGPENSHLSSITPQKTQILNKEETITFTLNFKSEEEFNPPSPPKNLSLKIVKSGILLKWGHSKLGSNLIGGYNIYRSLISQEGFIKITSVKATENTYLDEDVEIGRTYYYIVKAFDIKENESEASDEVKISISGEYISPFNLKAYPGDKKVYLGWTPPKFQKDLKGYYIYRSKVSGEYSEDPINQSPVLTNHYIDNDLENGVLYFYLCKAVYKDGTISSALQEVSVIPKELFITVDITDGEIVDNEKFTFSGSVDPDSIVLINGKEIKVEENGKFTATVNLSPGDNIITITVKNKAGDVVKIKRKVTLRTQSEEIEIKLQIGNTTMLVNNIPVQIDVPPTIVEGRTLLPIRWVAEPLGATVGWDGTERKVTVSLGDVFIELWIGRNTARVNGVEKMIDPNNPKVKPIIIKGRTMLPVRFVAENLGCEVKWDGSTKTVTIIYRKSP